MTTLISVGPNSTANNNTIINMTSEKQYVFQIPGSGPNDPYDIVVKTEAQLTDDDKVMILDQALNAYFDMPDSLKELFKKKISV